MKYLLVLVSLFLFTKTLFAQSSDDRMYTIIYLNSFKDRLSSKYPSKEYSKLCVSGNKSIYQIFNVMKVDSLKYKGIKDINYTSEYFSYNKHTINITDKQSTYLDVIHGDYYTYKEELNFNWTLGSKTKTFDVVVRSEPKEIKQFTCKNATTTYGGRTWEAWYSIDAPINAGPYKFKGLPGLIMGITSEDLTYGFNIYALVERDLKPLKKLFTSKPESEFVQISRDNFNAFKYKYEGLTLNEKLNYNNKGARMVVKRVDQEGTAELRDPSSKNKSSDVNLIELDFKK